MVAPVSAPADPLLDQVVRLLDELRERCVAPASAPGELSEDLLIDGYAVALTLEGTRRRLRAQALELAQRELELATREEELRELLGVLRTRLGPAREEAGVRASRGSAHEPAAQRLH